jgi:hypothetical protein
MNSVRKEGRRRPVKEKEMECEWVHWFKLANGRSQWRVFKVTETSSKHADNFFAVTGTLQQLQNAGDVCSSHTKCFDFIRDVGGGRQYYKTSFAWNGTVLTLHEGFPKFVRTLIGFSLVDHPNIKRKIL